MHQQKMHLIGCLIIHLIILLADGVQTKRRSPINGTWMQMGLMFNEQMQSDHVDLSCKSLPGLSAGQGRLCLLYKDHMNAVAYGAKQALYECKHQFQNRRWNCTLFNDIHLFGPIIKIASRESAFAYALSAASVTYSVARACRDGQLTTCGCSRMGRPRDLRKDWIWGGCGDNLEYGYKFTQNFVDVREKERKYKRGTKEQGRSLMNLHNNEAGRRAVIRKSKVTCKCHGVSGSCSLITCWKQLATFREIGDYLRDKYDGATEVRINRHGHLQLRNTDYRLPTSNDLIYLDDSPNYCIKNINLGTLGTYGRHCNRTSIDLDGCHLLCCGRGYNTIKIIQHERCHCQFKWCCHVECQICSHTIDLYTCK